MTVLAAAWGWLTSPVGKAAALFIACMLLLLAAYAWAEGRGETIGAARVQATIDHPLTGWRARLAVCEDARDGYATALDHQSAGVQALRDQAAADTARAERAAADARAVAESWRQQSVWIAAHPPQGADTCARLLDVDATVMESLK
jgi:hypothetical protein